MRALGYGLFVVAVAVACSDSTTVPIDAAVEHMVPADFGKPCSLGTGTCLGDFGDQHVSDCTDRCVYLAKLPAICTTHCLSNADCGSVAICMPLDTNTSACLLNQDPYAGCHDAAVDAPIVDAAADGPIVDAGVD